MRHDHDFAAQQPVATARAPLHAGYRLARYRVTNFRSVTDSGWLEADRVTALIGVNESGKTNLLLPLWKMNPASGGEIEPTSDYPKAIFTEIRDNPAAFDFVTAEFDTGAEAAALATLARIPEDEARRVSVTRAYDGSFRFGFPLHVRRDGESVETARTALTLARDRLEQDAPAGEAARAAEAKRRVTTLLTDLAAKATVTGNDLRLARNAVGELIPDSPPATSAVIPLLRNLQTTLGEAMAAMLAPDPASRDEVGAAILKKLPRFIYYSNYGNLDSEIYLPHIVENMTRADLGAKERAKARTLRVLFDFVGLKAEEVHELGRDFRDIREEAEAKRIEQEGRAGQARGFWRRVRGPQPDETAPDSEMLARIAEAKRTRSILLQSAGTQLTERFAEWWHQGDYRFRFEADGHHFRIWVADARRPQEVELEHRSTGLQWFLSFFLVFLQEAKGAHANSVLLLDEPGLSLHPLAQRDLSAFFEGLAATNQLIYTSHSPFLVDSDRLGRARKVFVDRDGSTRVTGDLMEGEGTDSKRGAAFAVRAALNMAVAEAGLGGAQAVLVRGRVEQTYLSLVKTLTIAAGEARPPREIVFAPAGAADIVRVMAALLGGTASPAPVLVLDAGRETRDVERAMPDAAEGAVVRLDSLTGMAGASVEDLMPADRLAALIDRIERRPESMFADRHDPGSPFVPQVEAWAEGEGIALAADWRLRLAERVRDSLLSAGAGAVPAATMDTWRDMIGRMSRP